MKSRNSLKSWLSSWTTGSALLTEIITQALTRLTGGADHGADDSLARLQAGRELGLIPCPVRARAARFETYRQLRRQTTHE